MNLNSIFGQKGKEQYVVSENVKVCKNANIVLMIVKNF